MNRHRVLDHAATVMYPKRHARHIWPFVYSVLAVIVPVYSYVHGPIPSGHHPRPLSPNKNASIAATINAAIDSLHIFVEPFVIRCRG